MDNNNMNNLEAMPQEQPIPEAVPQEAPQEQPVPEAATQEAPQEQPVPEAAPQEQPVPEAAPQEQPVPEAASQEAPQPQPQPMPQVAPQAPKKKGKGGLIAVIVIAVVLVVALLAGVTVLAFSLLGSPKSKVEKGFANMAKEMASYENPAMEKVQMNKILENMAKNGSVFDVSMNVTEMESMTSVGFDMTANVDEKNKMMDMNLGFSMMNFTIASMQIAADEENIYVAIPEMFEETLSLPVDDFAEKFNNSSLAYYTGIEVPEDYDLTIFPEDMEIADEVDEEELLKEYFSEAFLEKMEEDRAELIKNIQVEKYDETKEVTVDGKDIKCKGYLVTVGKDEINQLYEDIFDEMVNGKFGDMVVESMMLEMAEYGYTEEEIRDEWEYMMEDMSIAINKDLEIVIYMDSKNRIVSMELEKVKMDIMDVTVTIKGEVNFLGKDRTLDEIEGELDINGVTMTLQRSAETTKEEMNDSWTVELMGDVDYDEYIKMQFTNNWNLKKMEYYVDAYVQSDSDATTLELEVSGSIPDYEAGSSCTFEVEDATFYLDEEPMLMLSGEVTLGELQEEIKMPSDAWDILDASDSELEEFFSEVYNNVMTLMQGFYGMSY